MLPFAILGGCLAVGVLPALAADRGVGIHDFAFSPAKIAVMPGDTVTWTAEPGYTSYSHNVKFDDRATALGPPSSNPSPSTSSISGSTLSDAAASLAVSRARTFGLV